MHDVTLTVFAVTTLLGLVSLLLPLAERLAIPYAVMLAVVGIAIGAAAGILGDVAAGGIMGDILGTLNHFGLGAESLLTIFLPALLFEAALNVDVRHLSDEAAPVLLLAVVGVVVCTFAIGFALWSITSVGILACIILGAILATTDPVAVVGIFRDVGAPRRLSTLVEGESLFNDAAAIAIYSLVVAMVAADRPESPVDGILAFLREFCGGLAAGYAAGRLIALLLPGLRASRLAEATMTIGFAYLVFIIADHYLHVSGIVAVAASAIAISAGGRRRLAPSNWESLVVTWEQLAFWASSLIFLLAAMQAPHLLTAAHWGDLLLLAVLVAAALAARGATLFGLMPALSMAGIAEPIDNKYKIVMLWGGMRGAVSLALALAATENTALPPDMREFVGVLATGFVLFTLLVNAPTLRPLMRLLKLDRLSPAEIALRDRVIGLSVASIRQEIEDTAQQHEIALDTADEIAALYAGLGATPSGIPGNAELPVDLRERTALSVLADREQAFYRDYFEGRAVSRHGAGSLLAHAARLRDGARAAGIAGYRKAAARLTRFTLVFRLANTLHRRTGIGAPLAAQLANRFEMLLAARFVLQKLIRFNDDQIGVVFGAAPQQAMAAELAARFGDVERAIAALKLQYPSYARQLEMLFLARTAARVEEERYGQLHAEAIINRDVLDDLQRELRRRRRALEARPALDLGLNREELIARVPMFSVLDAAAHRAVARLLRPRLALPGEVILRKGDRGDAMYFISSGAVEVRIAPHPVPLGTGDFFGEMALLVADRRTADVVAISYCQLLSLAGRDLDRLFAAEPKIRDEIRAVASARQAEAEIT